MMHSRLRQRQSQSCQRWSQSSGGALRMTGHAVHQSQLRTVWIPCRSSRPKPWQIARLRTVHALTQGSRCGTVTRCALQTLPPRSASVCTRLACCTRCVAPLCRILLIVITSGPMSVSFTFHMHALMPGASAQKNFDLTLFTAPCSKSCFVAVHLPWISCSS